MFLRTQYKQSYIAPEVIFLNAKLIWEIQNIYIAKVIKLSLFRTLLNNFTQLPLGNLIYKELNNRIMHILIGERSMVFIK